MKMIRVITYALLYAVMSTVLVSAQSPAQNPAYLEAQRYEADGAYADAIAIYERLYDDESLDVYFWKLISLYEQTERWSDLERCAREKLDIQPANIEASRYLARSLFMQEKPDDGRQVLMDILDGNWEQNALVQFVAGEFQSIGEFPEAERVYLEAREHLDDQLAFAAELGQIYQYQERYIDGIREFVKVLDTYGSAYSHLVQLINDADDADTDLKEMSAPIREYLVGNPQSLNAGRLVSAILIEAGEYEDAYHLFRTPAIATGSYDDLWTFIEGLYEKHQEALTVTAYDDFVNAFPDNPRVILARMRAADILTVLGEQDEAEKRYRAIIGDYAGTYEAAEATLRLLELSIDDTDIEGYSRLLMDFAETIEFRKAACQAYQMLGDSYLKHGDTDEANIAYTKARLKADAGYDLYDISVRLATLAFYSGAYEQLVPEIRQAVTLQPDGAEINDLLAWRVLLMRCVTEHDREQYGAYAQGAYNVYLGNTDTAVGLYTTVATDTTTVIAPSAAVALADLYHAQGDEESAVIWYLKAADIADDTTLKAGAMLEAAKLSETLPDGRIHARALYVQALTDIPGTVYDMELRTRLQAVIER